MHQLFAFNTVQSGEGVGNEFIYIIAAVIGGCLLTGGYGSAIGPAFGAFIFGMASKGIVYADWNPDWFKFFLGAMLLARHPVNPWVRKRAEADRDDIDTAPTVPPAHAPTARLELDGVGKSLRQHPRPARCHPRRRTPARSPACSATTAPASPPSSRSSPGCTSTTEGTLLVDGEEVRLTSPRARPSTAGIATVYQDLAIVPLMPVWRNFFLGSEMTKGPGPFARLDIGRMRRPPTRNCATWASTCATSTSPSAPSPAASASAWPSPAPSTSAPGCSSSTSPPRRSASSSPASC